MISICTDKGLVRANNEDTIRVQDGRSPLYILCDGMGGHNAGEVASAMAAETLCELLKDRLPSERALEKAVRAANDRVLFSAAQNEEYAGMGTTLTALWEGKGVFLLAHVGDSRAYLMRDGQLMRMTRDHSVVAELMEQKLITAEQAKSHPYRHMITRAVGTDRRIQADIAAVEKRAGDRWLLCSDGLTDGVEDETIARLLAAPWSEDIAHTFVEEALSAGGRDNVSILCVEVVA